MKTKTGAPPYTYQLFKEKMYLFLDVGHYFCDHRETTVISYGVYVPKYFMVVLVTNHSISSYS